LKSDGTRAETRLCLSAKRTSPFKSAEASVQSTTGSRGVRMSGSDAGYTMLRGSVKGTGYTLHSPVSPSLSLPCVTVCHHISTGLYRRLAGCTPEPPGRLLVRPPHNMIPIVTAPCRLRIRLFYLQLLYSTQTVSCTIPAPVSCHLHHFSAECQHRVGDLQANK